MKDINRLISTVFLAVEVILILSWAQKVWVHEDLLSFSILKLLIGVYTYGAINSLEHAANPFAIPFNKRDMDFDMIKFKVVLSFIFTLIWIGLGVRFLWGTFL